MTLADLSGIASNVVQIIWGPSAAVAAYWAYKKARKADDEKRANEKTEREVEMRLLHRDVTLIIERMNKEFNGNSGGIRERINMIDGKVDLLDARVSENSIDLAKLTGRFDEHTDGN